LEPHQNWTNLKYYVRFFGVPIWLWKFLKNHQNANVILLSF
jgi:hypothetical protein